VAPLLHIRRKSTAVLAFVGALLILVGVGNHLATSLQPADADQALSRLVQIPVQQIQSQKLVETKFTAPGGPSWNRLRRAWGDPTYVIAVEPARNEQGCWDEFFLDVKSTILLKPVTTPLYGHMTECPGHPLGLEFQAGPDQHVNLQIASQSEQPLPPADLVVMANWSGDMKQRLGEVYVDETLRKISNWLMVLGGVCLAWAGIAARRSARMRIDPRPISP
jgi:hypothetical protein